MEKTETMEEKELRIANEIRKMNSELRSYHGWKEDYHEVNESQRMKINNNGRYR